MKSILIAHLLVVCAIATFAQQDIQYRAYTSADKEQVFFDDFNNPSDTLWVETGSVMIYIKDGYYHHFSDTGRFIATPFDVVLDSSKNYEIEFIAHVPGYNQSGIVFWGRRDATGLCNYWYFYKNGNSSFKNCMSFENCKSIDIKGKAHSKFNKYTLRRIDQFYYFYVNEKLRKTLPATHLYGNLFGLGSGTAKNRTAETVFDNIRISYLKK